MQSTTVETNPWDVDITGLDKRSKLFKDVTAARALVPEPKRDKAPETRTIQIPAKEKEFVPPTQAGFSPQATQNYQEPAKTITVADTSTFQFPERVILKPIQQQKFRLGLENTKEGFLRVPGVKYTWEPSIVGNAHKTGLDRLSSAQIAQLEAGIGRKLDSDFYTELSYRMDASNPNGHHMDLSRATEKIVYLAMLESHLIAEGLIQKQNGSKPEAEWYIENLEAEAEMKQKEHDKFRQVFMAYENMSDRKKVAFAKIMNVAVRGLSPAVAATKLWEMLLEKKTGYQKVWARFIDMASWGDDKINVFEEVKDAIASNLIRKNAAQDYIYGEEVLGSTEDQVISKLLQNENAGLRVAIKSKLMIR
jgi:hypothetical protein